MNISQKLVKAKNYSYVNARVRARRGDLIADGEYRKLMKMELAEIAEFMENRGYQGEVNEL
ncbi:MAG: V-type ATPase subunit, partial [Candidatus Nanohaloarchaea archaeon]